MGISLNFSHTTHRTSFNQSILSQWLLYTTFLLWSPPPSRSVWSSLRPPPLPSSPLSLAIPTTVLRPLTRRRSSSSPERQLPLLLLGDLLSSAPVFKLMVLLLCSMPLVLSATRVLPILVAWSSSPPPALVLLPKSSPRSVPSISSPSASLAASSRPLACPFSSPGGAPAPTPSTKFLAPRITSEG